MNLLDLIPALGIIAGILGTLEVTTIAKNQRYTNAILAIATAANATTAYLIASDKGKITDRDKEHSLSALWLHASIMLKEFNTDLAQRCDIKASYWLEPSTWREKDIATMQIRLSEITKEIDRLKTA